MKDADSDFSERQGFPAELVSEQELRLALDENVRDSLPSVALAAAGLYSFFAISHWLILPRFVAARLIAFAIPSAIVFTLLWVVLRRKLIPLTHAHRIGAGMVALVTVNTLLQIRVTGDIKQTTNVILVIVATGAFLLGTEWFALCLTATVLAWVAVAGTLQSGQRLHFGFAMLSSVVLSALVHVVRVRSIAKVESLRKKEHGLRLTAEMAVEATRSSEKRYRELVENSMGLIFTHDLDGQILSVNPAAAKALGYSASELVGRHLLKFVSEVDQTGFENYLQLIRKERTVEGYLTVATKSRDNRTWFYRNFHFEEPGGASYVIGHAQDISGILLGVLPICASCKRIRNQSGDWEQVEIYIREHTHAEFSHGICPDCRQRLYPGLGTGVRDYDG